jgi:hypothetical protein
MRIKLTAVSVAFFKSALLKKEKRVVFFCHLVQFSAARMRHVQE